MEESGSLRTGAELHSGRRHLAEGLGSLIRAAVTSVDCTEKSLEEALSRLNLLAELRRSGGTESAPNPMAAVCPDIVAEVARELCEIYRAPAEVLHPEGIEALRYRVVAVAAQLKAGKSTVLELALGSESGPRAAAGTLSLWPAQVRTCRVADELVVLLPKITSPSHSWHVLDTLNEIFLQRDLDFDWLVDCSGIDATQMVAFSSLIGYKRDFVRVARAMRLMWLPKASIPSLLEERLKEIFELQLVGGHYFSKR